MYIAQKRFQEKIPPEQNVVLTDKDQFAIMKNQLEIENVMSYSIGVNGILITDTSPLNSLLYMTNMPTPEPDSELWGLTQNSVGTCDIEFYCPPVELPSAFDPNRVHNLEQSIAIDKRIPKLAELLNLRGITPLSGNVSNRCSVAYNYVLNQIYKRSISNDI